MEKLLPLAEGLEAAVSGGHRELDRNPSRVAWSGFALSLLYYRRGDHAKADEWLELCLRETGANPSRDAAARCLAVMIDAKLGRSAEASMHLDRARSVIDARFAEGLKLGDVNSFWFDWVNARVFLREASLAVRRPGAEAENF